MSTSEVIGVQSSRFQRCYPSNVKFRSRSGPYMERCDSETLSSSLWLHSWIWHWMN